MANLLMNPAIQSGVIPLLTALTAVLLCGLINDRFSRFAGISVLVGFLAAYYLTFDLPPFPPKASGQKIAYIAALAGVLGLYINLRNIPDKALWVIGLVVSALSVGWIGWLKIQAPLSLDHLNSLLIVVAGTVAFYRMTHRPLTKNSDEADNIIALIAVLIAVSAVAIFASSASIGQNAGALAAALGGLMLVNWPKRRHGLDVVARVVPLVTLTALLAQLVLFTNVVAWPLILLPLVMLASPVANRWVVPHSSRAELLRPILIGALCAVPALASIIITWNLTSASASGY